MLDAYTDISTLSLYEIADYCLTVRGTTGIEGACFGCNVLTAGTGRYDGKGFTIDSKSPSEYLKKIENIHQISVMSTEKKTVSTEVCIWSFYQSTHKTRFN